jgi:6-phosphogluconolactonase (cycloisomerase 2 family)
MRDPGRGRRRTVGALVVVVAVLSAPAPAIADGSLYVVDRVGAIVSQHRIGVGGGLGPASGGGVPTGPNPRMIALAPDGRNAYVTNEDDGTVSQYSVDPVSGALTPKPTPTVSAGRTALAVVVTPDGRSAYASAGDGIAQWSIDATTGELQPKVPAKAAGAGLVFGLAVTPDGRSLYAVGPFFTNAQAVDQYDIDPVTGALRPKPPDAHALTGQTPTDIAVAPDGSSAYVSNAFSGDVSQFDVNPASGWLAAKSPPSVMVGGYPSAIVLSPDGRSAYVAAGGATPVIAQFDVAATTGLLTPKTPPTVPKGQNIGDLALSPDGHSLYASNGTESTISQYDVDPVTGRLTLKGPATVASANPLGMAAGRFPAPAERHPTTTTVRCHPSVVVAWGPGRQGPGRRGAACRVTVQDTSPSATTAPSGAVALASSGPGTFVPAACTLTAAGPRRASCTASYRPDAAAKTSLRADTITAAYAGDGGHAGSSGTARVLVLSVAGR